MPMIILMIKTLLLLTTASSSSLPLLKMNSLVSFSSGFPQMMMARMICLIHRTSKTNSSFHRILMQIPLQGKQRPSHLRTAIMRLYSRSNMKPALANRCVSLAATSNLVIGSNLNAIYDGQRGMFGCLSTQSSFQVISQYSNTSMPSFGKRIKSF